MSLQQRTTSDLLYLLDRAYLGRDVTLIKCVTCDNGARDTWCADCIAAELRDRFPRGYIDSLMKLLSDRYFAERRIEKAKMRLLEAAT